jgi:hypothetical protein
MKTIIIIVSSVLLTIIFGCTEDLPLIPDSNLVVVQAYLYAGEPVQNIRLTSTLAIDADTSKAPPIDDAEVVLIKDGQWFKLAASPGDSGYYHYAGNDLIVQTDDLFRIEITYNDELISAETSVPEAPVNLALSDNVLHVPDYFDPSQIGEITLSWTNENEVLYFVVIDNLEDNPQEIETGRPSSSAKRLISQPISRDSFPINFRSVTHRGKHRVKLYRINQEYADLYQSREQDSRDLNEPLTNIVNGLGIFSAFNSDSVFFDVVP